MSEGQLIADFFSAVEKRLNELDREFVLEVRPIMKIQSLHALRDEMTAAARGERVPCAQANAPVYETTQTRLCRCTPANRKLLAIIAQKAIKSAAALPLLSSRAESNLSRTLAKLQSAGIIRIDRGDGRAEAPSVAIDTLHLEADVFTVQDHVEVVAA